MWGEKYIIVIILGSCWKWTLFILKKLMKLQSRKISTHVDGDFSNTIAVTVNFDGEAVEKLQMYCVEEDLIVYSVILLPAKGNIV